jgi:hypothetical protein
MKRAILAAAALLTFAVPTAASAGVGDPTLQAATYESGVYASGYADTGGAPGTAFEINFMQPLGGVNATHPLNQQSADLGETWATLWESSSASEVCRSFSNPATYSVLGGGDGAGAIRRLSFDASCADGSGYDHYRVTVDQATPFNEYELAQRDAGYWTVDSLRWSANPTGTGGWIGFVAPGSPDSGLGAVWGWQVAWNGEGTTTSVCGVRSDRTVGTCVTGSGVIYPVAHNVVVSEAGSDTVASQLQHPSVPSFTKLFSEVTNLIIDTAHGVGL